MNVERLRMVKDVILKNPERTKMESVHSADGCHCIFGWAQVLFSPRFLDRFCRGWLVKPPASEQELFAYLGMSYAEGRRLYHVGLWPEYLIERYYRATTAQQRASVIAEAIETFIVDPGFKNDIAYTSRERMLAGALV